MPREPGPELRRLVATQVGVVSRRQVLALGHDDELIARMLRTRRWVRVHTGVYVDHTGRLDWEQRAWAAVLRFEPAALSGASALRAHTPPLHGGPRLIDDGAPIELVVALSRHLQPIHGVRLTRVKGFEAVVHPGPQPPRVRHELALLQAASRRPTESAALALLADACQRGTTTPARLVEALARSPRLRRRALLLEILSDVSTGAYSVLERRFLVHVERAHGLPTAKRQRVVRQGRSMAHRDVDYVALATVIELDGRLGHELAADRWADQDRDIDSLLGGDVTMRVGWAQVLEPCRLALLVARLLTARGWQGHPSACGPRCVVAARRVHHTTVG